MRNALKPGSMAVWLIVRNTLAIIMFFLMGFGVDLLERRMLGWRVATSPPTPNEPAILIACAIGMVIARRLRARLAMFFVAGTAAWRVTMFLIRDIMYCKPGQVKAMTQKFLALSKHTQKMGMGTMRVMTDVSAERYWTVVSEIEVPSLEAYAETSRKNMENKEFQDAMRGYHDLIDHGRREIYMIEK